MSFQETPKEKNTADETWLNHLLGWSTSPPDGSSSDMFQWRTRLTESKGQSVLIKESTASRADRKQWGTFSCTTESQQENRPNKYLYVVSLGEESGGFRGPSIKLCFAGARCWPARSATLRSTSAGWTLTPSKGQDIQRKLHTGTHTHTLTMYMHTRATEVFWPLNSPKVGSVKAHYCLFWDKRLLSNWPWNDQMNFNIIFYRPWKIIPNDMKHDN